ncbi:YrdB family protein [Prauserella muralis]|uniref:Uncharacterized protein n=1 Tax=Prauserella muralis TaxID=588067 RepID=A0A2V4BP41_9PSEU|nr:YrdB family protein [Prauserella muralis]PXY32383.1 hypothetical protein BAY60_08945 [Prauserella muralis]TWE23931.1 uncharacterized protein DUF2568 [Prauserella muralis]
MNGALRWSNEILAFLLELAALVALAYWGFTADLGTVRAIVLGLCAPTFAAVLWGLFAAPRARFPLPVPGVLAVKALVFGAAAAALYAREHAVLATVFAVVVLVNTVVVTGYRHRERQRGAAPGT